MPSSPSQPRPQLLHLSSRPVRLCPQTPHWQQRPPLCFLTVRIPIGYQVTPEQGSLFLRRLAGLQYRMGWFIWAICTDDGVQVQSQYRVAQADRLLLEAAVHYAFPGAVVRPEEDLVVQLRHRLNDRRATYASFEFDLRDLRAVSTASYGSHLQFLSVAASLRRDEILYQDVLIQPDPDGEARSFHMSVRYGTFTERGRRMYILHALLGQDVPAFSAADYYRVGLNGRAFVDMMERQQIHHRGLPVTPQQIAGLLTLLWASQGLQHLGIRIDQLAGTPPHESLLSGAVPVGISLYDGTGLIVHLSTDHINGPIYIIGERGTGKSTLIERLTAWRMAAEEGQQTLLVIEQKGPLAERLLGMVPQDQLDRVVYYHPGRHPFYCNVLDIAEHADNEAFISALAHAAENRNSMGVTPNVRVMIGWGMRALKPWAERATLYHLMAFINDADFRKQVLARNGDGEVHAFVRNTLRAMPPTSIRAFENKIDGFIRVEALRNTTCQPENRLRLSQHLDQRSLMFLNLSQLTRELASEVGTLHFTQAVAAAFARGSQEHTQRWFTLVLDEFQEWIHPDALQRLLTQGRAFHAAPILAHQNHEQLSPQTLGTVLGNSPVKCCFRVNHHTARTMAQVMEVAPQELIHLNNYEAYLKVGVLPATKIKLLPPLGCRADIAQQAIIRSQETYGAPSIDRMDPHALFDDAPTVAKAPPETAASAPSRFHVLTTAWSHDHAIE